MTLIKEKNTAPDPKIITVTESGDKILYSIPAKGIKGSGLVTMIVIMIWLLTILVWTAILLMMKPVNALYSLPLWGIGIFTLIKSLKILKLDQFIEISANEIVLRMRQGSKFDEKRFDKNSVSLSLVEGSYYSTNGLMRRGQYPAIISKDEAFGFGERLSVKEKQWLLDSIKEKL